MGEDVVTNPKLFELPPDGKVLLPDFEIVRQEDLPEEAIYQIDLNMGLHEAIRRRLIKTPLKLDFNSAGYAYLMAYDFEAGNEGLAKFRGVFEADISADGEYMGSGFSLIDLDEVGREKVRPYVGHTFTEPGFIRKGLGLRRLFILNEANKKWFGDSLGSGLFIPSDDDEDPYAKAMWEQLVAHGFAVKEDETFRFKDD